MRIIYHLISRAQWEQRPSAALEAPSLATEGFIHCANRDQVAWAANRFHAKTHDLVVLALDANRLGDILREEIAGNGESYPHIYGPIFPEYVVAVLPMEKATDGSWKLPEFHPGSPETKGPG